MLHKRSTRLLPRVAESLLLRRLAVCLPLLRIEHILLHTQADIVRVARKALATNWRKRSRHVVAVLRLHKHRVIRKAELLEAANIRYDLWNTHTHLLKVAETPALAVRRIDANIRRIIEHVDVLVLEVHVAGAQHQTVAELFHAHATHLELPLEDLKDPPPTLLTLVADTEKEERLRRVLHNQLHECHDQQIITLARLVAVHAQKQEGVVRETHVLPHQLPRHRVELLGVKSVEQHVNRTGDTLVLDALLPEGREGEDTIRITVDDIQIHLQLCRIDLVNVNPDLEGARKAGLANLL